MKKIILSTVALAALTLSAHEAMADSVNDQVATFRAERHFIDRAYIRCNERVAEKYRSQLYGLNAVNGNARKPVEAAADAEREVCKVNHTRKATALFDKQSPEVHAFYKQRSAELKAEANKIDEEAVR
ncbi:hypothetical protein V2E67_002129 [Citrobacter freundii]|nr:hypothetical protein [Citrobacter freundii]